MMFTGYLKQTASYEAATTPDVYGDFSWSTAENVSCRIEKELKVIQKQNGELIKSTTTYFLPFEPTIGSKIDGLTIMEVADNPALSGMTGVYEAYC